MYEKSTGLHRQIRTPSAWGDFVQWNRCMGPSGSQRSLSPFISGLPCTWSNSSGMLAICLLHTHKKMGVEAKDQILWLFLARPKVLTAQTWRKTKDDLWAEFRIFSSQQCCSCCAVSHHDDHDEDLTSKIEQWAFKAAGLHPINLKHLSRFVIRIKLSLKDVTGVQNSDAAEKGRGQTQANICKFVQQWTKFPFYCTGWLLKP